MTLTSVHSISLTRKGVVLQRLITQIANLALLSRFKSQDGKEAGMIQCKVAYQINKI